MAKVRGGRTVPDAVYVLEDESHAQQHALTRDGLIERSRVHNGKSGTTTLGSDESDDEDVESPIIEEIEKFERSFRDISKRYRFINRIGEGRYFSHCRNPGLLTPLLGTFSTVYKAEDLEYDRHQNDWDIEEKENIPVGRFQIKPTKTIGAKRRYVAIKKIYVTSSPSRIFNELELLQDLKNSNSVCPLITAFRHHDQVVAILPYFRHSDFRDYFRQFQVEDMRHYLRSLFTALAAIHSKRVLHRDIKPTNFLYNTDRRQGVLVDFGLAEREGTDYHPCLCTLSPSKRHAITEQSYHVTQNLQNPSGLTGYPKEDTRPSRRSNRAGTRGFRAPEVLLKCTAQTAKIDTWSAGVILLSILSRRFPFFHSADDIDATIELSTIFGKSKMRGCSLLHGVVFETNLPTISENGFSFEKIILWSTNRNAGKDEEGKRIEREPLEREEREAVAFLERCLELDSEKRISAADALNHPFLLTDENNIRSESSNDFEMH